MKALVHDVSTAAENDLSTRAGSSTFSRVLVGVDGSKEALEAARYAAILAEAPVKLLAVYDLSALTAATGAATPIYVDDGVQRLAAVDALDRARQAVSGYDQIAGGVVRGCPWAALIQEAENDQDTVVVVGSHGSGRARGVLVGSTATELVHKSPCSVLVARTRARVPQRIVVGVDGSPESERAYAAARLLAERFGSHLRPLVDQLGKGVDMDRVRAIVGHGVNETMRGPVRALVGASGIVDLVVVGSRGLHGLKALGSVSERVAHEALCPVLIVREAPWQQVEEVESE